MFIKNIKIKSQFGKQKARFIYEKSFEKTINKY